MQNKWRTRLAPPLSGDPAITQPRPPTRCATFPTRRRNVQRTAAASLIIAIVSVFCMEWLVTP